MVKIDTISEDNYHLIQVNGEIDASSSIELDAALKEASENTSKILIDLTSLEYISSAGLGVFISYLEELKKKEVSLVIFGLKEKVHEVFEILGLQHLMNIVETKEEAVKAVNEA
ncbi:STAS domain-containing protein [Marinoscillum pacificum]|uniref:STAS domain-containing protein n=1 Tax=Marinoscillum pacificum TaxID=392723 RepID=UPI0021573FFE|nr:STAS domain-containing protein [Marinoscillum pacificum]